MGRLTGCSGFLEREESQIQSSGEVVLVHFPEAGWTEALEPGGEERGALGRDEAGQQGEQQQHRVTALAQGPRYTETTAECGRNFTRSSHIIFTH